MAGAAPDCSLPSGEECSWVVLPLRLEEGAFGIARAGEKTILVQTAPVRRVLLTEGDLSDGKAVSPLLRLVPGEDEVALLVATSGLYRLGSDGAVSPVIRAGAQLDDGTRFERPKRAVATGPDGWAVVCATDSGDALLRVEGSRAIPVLRPRQLVPGAGTIEEIGVSTGGPILEAGPDGTLVFSVRTVDSRVFVLLATVEGFQVLGSGQMVDIAAAGEDASPAGDVSGGWIRSPLDQGLNAIEEPVSAGLRLSGGTSIVNLVTGAAGAQIFEPMSATSATPPGMIGPPLSGPGSVRVHQVLIREQ